MACRLATPLSSARLGSADLQIHVQPRSSRTEIAGAHGDAIKVRLAAPPVDGAANAELIRFLAERLGVRRNDVTVVRGETSRRKAVRIAGMTADAARACLLGTSKSPGSRPPE